MSDLVSAITARFDHPNRKYRRSREEAAAIVAEAIGAPYSTETLRKTPTPYASIFGRVRYADEDLLALATSILSGAQKCGRTSVERAPTPHPEQGMRPFGEELGETA
jgi:hypothetical protein